MNSNFVLYSSVAVFMWAYMAGPNEQPVAPVQAPAEPTLAASPFTDPCFRDPLAKDCRRISTGIQKPLTPPKTPMAAVRAVENGCRNESELVCDHKTGLDLVDCVKARGDRLTTECSRTYQLSRPMLKRAYQLRALETAGVNHDARATR